MADDNGPTSAHAEILGNKFSFSGKKTAEFILILLSIGVGIGAYVLYVHAKDSEVRDQKVERVFEKIEKAIDKSSGSHRFFACVIAHDQKDRMNQIEQANSLCNRMATQ